MTDLYLCSFSEIKSLLQQGKLTLVQLVQQYLQRIDNDKNLNCWIEVYSKEALEKAAIIDAKIQKGESGALAGMVLGVKDVIAQAGKSLTSSSKMLQGYVSPYTSTALQRLLDADALVIGSLNCDEFAMGSSNETSFYGPVHHPLQHNLVPGGSSGGSAAALAAGHCTATLGSDTGGSIRQPSSFCGLYGYKPTYGLVSRYGLIAYASSFDQIGTFTRHAFDTNILIGVMQGKDSLDATSVDIILDFKKPQRDKKYKLAYCKEAVEMEGLDPEIKNQFLENMEQWKKLGHIVDAVSFPNLNALVPTYYVLTTAEASSNLARFDGVKYGFSSQNSNSLESLYKQSRTEGFGTEVKRRIMLGTFVLSSGYYDAYYTKAQKVRRKIQDYTKEILSQYDMILSPTTPTTAFALGEKSKDPIAMYLADIYTVKANIVGMPAINIPMFTHSNGLPFGLHAMANFWCDAELLNFASQASQLIKNN